MKETGTAETDNTGLSGQGNLPAGRTDGRTESVAAVGKWDEYNMKDILLRENSRHIDTRLQFHLTC